MPDKKRFGLNSPRELLAKLDWEMEQYNQSPAQQEIASYRAFNCAVTAWSLCDWVWNAASDDLKAKFRAASPSSKTDSPEILAALLRAESRELAICQQLANGAKHFVRNQNNDPQVSSLRLQSVSIFVGDDGQETRSVPTHGVFVRDDTKLYADISLFSRARDYWHDFFERYQVE
jgi:hypothetical protein